ncbi:MAG: NUDIX domain-containing protein [Anaerolineae bacterium]|nr:NUDIX domain-containing protein [Anaerolineae bacterium]
MKDERPLVAVDVVIFSLHANNRPSNSLSLDLNVLLVQRDYAPYLGVWALPGHVISLNESLEDAARRIMNEKAHGQDLYLEQLFTFGEVRRDPRARVVSVTYFALVRQEQIEVRPGAAWHSMYALPDLAFDHHKILEYAHKRLRFKLEYTAVAFELMPETFTLRELQEAYMVILNDQRLDKANFRKKLRPKDAETDSIVEPTGMYRRTRGRPAELYRFREDAKRREIKARRLFP